MKKNYYELTQEELEKYNKEWAQTPYYKMSMRSLLIAAGICVAIVAFMLIFCLFEDDLFSLCIESGIVVLTIVMGMIACLSIVMKLEKDFPRWLKVKHNIDY